MSENVRPIHSVGEVYRFPDRGHSPELTKQQIANHLQRSPRWVELMTRDQGLPAGWDRHHRERRYDVRAVEAWLQERVA